VAAALSGALFYAFEATALGLSLDAVGLWLLALGVLATYVLDTALDFRDLPQTQALPMPMRALWLGFAACTAAMLVLALSAPMAYAPPLTILAAASLTYRRWKQTLPKDLCVAALWLFALLSLPLNWTEPPDTLPLVALALFFLLLVNLILCDLLDSTVDRHKSVRCLVLWLGQRSVRQLGLRLCLFSGALWWFSGSLMLWLPPLIIYLWLLLDASRFSRGTRRLLIDGALLLPLASHWLTA
jgi:hypothetical protein